MVSGVRACHSQSHSGASANFNYIIINFFYDQVVKVCQLCVPKSINDKDPAMMSQMYGSFGQYTAA